jgi:hypothetical protein
MTRFFEVTFKPFFVITGVGTALAFFNAFWPRWAVETVEKVAFVQDYTVIVQHWGMMVGLMGVFMIVAAFRPTWRRSILIYSGVEKAFMVWLVVTNWGRPEAQGLHVGAVMDATVVLYTLGFFATMGFGACAEGASDAKGPAEA